MKKIQRTLLITLLLGTTGCAELLEKDFLEGFLPTVSFSTLDVQYIDFDHIETDFVFQIDNPNPVGFSVDNFDYQLQFANIDWASGDNPDGLVINPSNANELSLPMDIVFEDLYDMVQASRGLDDIPFGVAGNFGILLDESSVILDDSSSNVSQNASGAYLVNVPYDADGDFPALRKPDFVFQGLEVRDLSWDAASLDLVIDVDNEHASNLLFTRFEYDLNLGAGTLLQGVADNLDQMIHGVDNSNQNRTLRIPIQINTVETVSSLAGILIGGQQLNANLKAITDVDTPFGLVELAIDEQGNLTVQ